MRRPSPLPPSSSEPDEADATTVRATTQPRVVGPPLTRPRAAEAHVAAEAPVAAEADVAARAGARTGADPDRTDTLPVEPVTPALLRDPVLDSRGDVEHITRPSLPAAPPARAEPGGPDRLEEPARSATTGLRAGLESAEADARSGEVGMLDVLRAARARRRALRAEVRRFTVRQRRRRMAWIGSLAALVLLGLGTLGAAYSPLFAVQTVTVEGATQLDSTAVQEALSSQLGTPLPLVDASAVKAALVTFPLVETYSLEARPPHELVVRIVERTPIGVIGSPAGYTLVDAAGVALSTTSTPPAGQPVIEVTGGVESDAFTAVGHVVRSLPEALRPQVTAVSATTPNDVTLTLGATDTRIVWGGAEDSALKSVVLETTMTKLPPETVSVYDVSAPGAVVVQ